MNIQFTAQQKQSLDEMARKLDTNISGVFQKALALLSVTVSEHKQQNEVAIVKNGEVVKKIIGMGKQNV